MRKCRIFALVFCGLITVSSYAQSEMKGNLVFSAGYYYGFFPNGPISPLPHEHIDSLNAVKLGGFWELPFENQFNLSFGLEVGYSSGSRFGGNSPMDIIPMAITTAYTYTFANIFSVGPLLKLGAFGISTPNGFSMVPLVGPRLDIELQILPIPVSLYASGGIDMLFPIGHEFSMLPVVEVGIRLPRGTWGFSGTSARSSQSAITDQRGPPPATDQDAGTDRPSQTTPAAQGATQTQRAPLVPLPFQSMSRDNLGLLSSVYFEPDTATIIESSRTIVDAVGRQLADNPSLRVLLRSYAAPFNTVGGQQMVSEERALFCRDYFIRNYGIAAGRISYELFGGSETTPEQVTHEWGSYRCVELIVIQE
jgi:outer membrane protein OmpA-like peptidoglycan-associated protein